MMCIFTEKIPESYPTCEDKRDCEDLADWYMENQGSGPDGWCIYEEAGLNQCCAFCKEKS